MPALSTHAADILGKMQPNIGYEASELRQFIPELSAEALRDVMRELWIERRVERFGYTGWRRVRQACGPRDASVLAGAGQVKTVKPEDLFDHDSFAGIFK